MILYGSWDKVRSEGADMVFLPVLFLGLKSTVYCSEFQLGKYLTTQPPKNKASLYLPKPSIDRTPIFAYGIQAKVGLNYL
jgi:hypothetical protein